jgi:putative hydroxymethylpyrimidine transport system substrate-binding protein
VGKTISRRTHHVIRRTIAAIAVIALLGIAACGEKDEPAGGGAADRLTLMLDYFPNADHAGIYAAQASGAFRQAGLDVDVKTPSDPAAPLKLLAAGKVDVAISYEPEVLLARDRGLDVVSIGAVVQKPLTSIMSLASKRIRTPEDLEGKRVGTAGIPYQSAYLRTILDRAGVDAGSVREVSVGFNLVPAMLSKKVDATLGAFWNYEGVQLAREGKHPRIIRMEQAGVPVYDELVLVARRDALSGERREELHRLLVALGRGHRSAREDPEAAVDALVRAAPDLDKGLQLASLQATLPVMFPPEGRPWGWQDPAAWRAYAAWMKARGLLERTPVASAAMTNDLLAGQEVDDQG